MTNATWDRPPPCPPPPPPHPPRRHPTLPFPPRLPLAAPERRSHSPEAPHEKSPFERRLSRGVNGPSRRLLWKSGSSVVASRGSGVASLRIPVTAKMSQSCGVCEKRAEAVRGLSDAVGSGALASRTWLGVGVG